MNVIVAKLERQSAKSQTFFFSDRSFLALQPPLLPAEWADWTVAHPICRCLSRESPKIGYASRLQHAGQPELPWGLRRARRGDPLFCGAKLKRNSANLCLGPRMIWGNQGQKQTPCTTINTSSRILRQISNCQRYLFPSEQQSTS